MVVVDVVEARHALSSGGKPYILYVRDTTTTHEMAWMGLKPSSLVTKHKTKQIHWIICACPHPRTYILHRVRFLLQGKSSSFLLD